MFSLVNKKAAVTYSKAEKSQLGKPNEETGGKEGWDEREMSQPLKKQDASSQVKPWPHGNI